MNYSNATFGAILREGGLQVATTNAGTRGGSTPAAPGVIVQAPVPTSPSQLTPQQAFAPGSPAMAVTSQPPAMNNKLFLYGGLAFLAYFLLK